MMNNNSLVTLTNCAFMNNGAAVRSNNTISIRQTKMIINGNQTTMITNTNSILNNDSASIDMYSSKADMTNVVFSGNSLTGGTLRQSSGPSVLMFSSQALLDNVAFHDKSAMVNVSPRLPFVHVLVP
jgi:hypothetical protein